MEFSVARNKRLASWRLRTDLFNNLWRDDPLRVVGFAVTTPWHIVKVVVK